MSTREGQDWLITHLRELEDAIVGGGLTTLREVIVKHSQFRARDDVLADALVISCGQGHYEAAHYLLAVENAKADSTSGNVRYCRDIPPLVLAVKYCETTFCQGSQLNAGGDHASSTHPLPEPAGSNQPEDVLKIIISLLKHGASLTGCGTDGKNALMHVVRVEVAEVLLAFKGENERRKALTQQRDGDGNDALMCAIVNHICSDDVALVYIRHGADRHTVDKEGRTALMNAAWKKRVHVIEELVRDQSIAMRLDKRGRNIWHHVAADVGLKWIDRSTALLFEHVDRELSANATDSVGQTPLHLSALFGTIAFAEELLEKRNPNVHATEWIQNKTALHFAAVEGNAEFVRLLLRCGANRSARCTGGITPLHLACECKRDAVEVVALLLDYDAANQLESRTEDNMTPLHIAAAQGNEQIVSFILKSHPYKNIDARCEGGWTALHLACGRHELLGKHPNNEMSRFNKKAGMLNQSKADLDLKYFNIVRVVLAAGANVNAKAQLARTALHVAAELGHVEIVELLLQQKHIQVSARDSLGNTPLLEAKKSIHYDQISRLLVQVAPWDDIPNQAPPQHGSSTQAEVVSTHGDTNESFYDSGLGTSIGERCDVTSNAPRSSASSIRSAWSAVGLEEPLREDLKDLFVDRLASETQMFLESDAALEEIPNLLRDFAILLRQDSTLTAQHEAAKFVRHERFSLAADYSEEARSRMRLHLRDTFDSKAIVSEWLAGAVPFEEPIVEPDQVGDWDATDIDHPKRSKADGPAWKLTEQHRTFLLESRQFEWLVSRTRMLTSRSCIGNEHHAIRSIIARHLDRTSQTSRLTITLRSWNPLRFLEQQYPDAECELAQILVYCGSLEAPYACTTAEYLEWMWPDVGRALLQCMQSACATSNSTIEVGGSSLFVQLQRERTTVVLSGNGQGVLELGEACVWLATACRAYDEGDCLATCLPRLDEHSLEMTVSYEPVPKEQMSADGLCWSKMVMNPVIASGYPVPKRSNMDSQKGLEASIGILVALSHANWATTFHGKFMIKGLRSALVPVAEDDTSITWHFTTTEDLNCHMTYNEAYAMASDSKVTIGEVNGPKRRRHFVGIWTPSARILTGSNDSGKALYQFYQSNSERLEYLTLTPSTFTINGGKFLTAGVSMVLGVKDNYLATVEAKDFEFQLSKASYWRVLLYGGDDKRAWLVDGLSALLHLSIAWLVEMAPEEHLAAFHFGPLHAGRPNALRVLLDNRGLPIHQRPEGNKIETVWSQSISVSSHTPVVDSAYGSGNEPSTTSVKQDRKSTSSEFTYEALVDYFFRTLEAMVDSIARTSKAPPHLKIKMPENSHLLVGWEAKDIVLQRTDKGKALAVWCTLEPTLTLPRRP